MNIISGLEIPNLDDYKNYPETQKCYLDGRYFDLIFKNFPGFIKSPLYIKNIIDTTNNNFKTSIEIKDFKINMNQPISIIRVIIETSENRHSAVIIIRNEEFGYKGYFFDPSTSTLTSENNEFILLLIKDAFGIPIEMIQIYDVLDAGTPGCDITGFCVAYSIKYVYDYLNNRPFNSSNIRKFASKIESIYPPLDPNNPDIEYRGGGHGGGGHGGGHGGGYGHGYGGYGHGGWGRRGYGGYGGYGGWGYGGYGGYWPWWVWPWWI